MVIQLTSRQIELVTQDVDEIVIGGARGGAKSFGLAYTAAFYVREDYTPSEFNRLPKDYREGFWRKISDDKGKVTRYFRYSIDYPNYSAVLVRRTIPQYKATTKVECDKLYPHEGGRWSETDQTYTFPSGAKILMRPCYTKDHIEFFQGGNFNFLGVEELTQFDKETIELIGAGFRTVDPRLKCMKVYTTNPGGRGHNWVKALVKKCPAIPVGDYIEVEGYEYKGEVLKYKRLKTNKPVKLESGETFLFIPALVFDNPHITENDQSYIRNLLRKPDNYIQMWLFGNWDVYVGQFFKMFQEERHILDEEAFFGAKHRVDLAQKKRHFDWTGYDLYRSYDYGYGSAWACGAYAFHKESGISYKFAELVEADLTSSQQAQRVNEYFKTHYNLEPEDFLDEFADPKSYWARVESGENFRTPADIYEDYGILLTPSNNDRKQGAMAVADMLIGEKDKTPTLIFLSNCIETIDCISSIPSSESNPEDVDTDYFDHPYDETRYYCIIKNSASPHSPTKKNKARWLERIQPSINRTIDAVKNWKVS
jgi:hypothetical protein